METVIRNYRHEDYQQLLSLWTKLNITNKERGDTENSISKTLLNGGKLLILEENNKLIGTVWITNDGRRLYLHHLAVDPQFQGRGLGRLLVEESLKFAKNINMQIKLEVLSDNKKLIDLYEKCGFKYLGDYDIYIIRKH